MQWKENKENQYPNIALSDCVVKGIRIKEDKIKVIFSEYGFFIKESKDNAYYRTFPAEILIKGCTLDYTTIKLLRMEQLADGRYIEIAEDVEAMDFIEYVNTEKWSLELVQEFYSCTGGLYVGRIGEGEKFFWCYIKLYFEKIVYFWNEINYDFPA